MSGKLTRRSMMQSLLGAAAASMAASCATAELWAQQGDDQIAGRERGEMGRLVAEFKRTFSVPALSVAIARNGQFVYDRPFGIADREKAMQTEQSSLFRIASVSKPITSVTIFRLLEQGKLNLNDKVFGPSGVLGTKYGKTPYKQYVTDIEVDHLLTHTCGGWPNDNSDPMFQHDSWDHQKLISWTLENLPLTYPPGQHWAYSNFGYCVLGRVIEQVTGQPYDEYVQSNILAPCGIQGMHIGRNKEGQRFPNEVVYYGQYSEDPYNMNVTRMDSHGGWIATPSDLVQFLNHLGGFPDNPSLLKPETIRSMVTPGPTFPQNSAVKYARGWNVRQDGKGNWWHTGSLPGTTSIMVRTSTRMCWAALANTRTEPHAQMDAALDQLIWNMVNVVPAWGA
ncbi:MAG TPA: serine hydrolase domain-containing protein [Candidatus Sulfotelmatobacter sp.]|nr:serine hydrolase domain-containing protein [Candidatus Sulfotelmatobacter sp.]